ESIVKDAEAAAEDRLGRARPTCPRCPRERESGRKVQVVADIGLVLIPQAKTQCKAGCNPPVIGNEQPVICPRNLLQGFTGSDRKLRRVGIPENRVAVLIEVYKSERTAIVVFRAVTDADVTHTDPELDRVVCEHRGGGVVLKFELALTVIAAPDL